MVAERPSQKSLRLTAIDNNGKMKVYLVMARVNEINQLHLALKERIEKRKISHPKELLPIVSAGDDEVAGDVSFDDAEEIHTATKGKGEDTDPSDDKHPLQDTNSTSSAMRDDGSDVEDAQNQQNQQKDESNEKKDAVKLTSADEVKQNPLPDDHDEKKEGAASDEKLLPSAAPEQDPVSINVDDK